MPQPYNVFTIYAREDARLLSELLSQLKPLEISGRIKVWSDREINPGVQWEQEIVSHLDTADIILILVSPAYYNSEYIHRVEIKRAVERHQRGEATVLPIIVRPCSFEDDPVVSSLQVLPTDGKAVTDDEHWRSQDKAWLDVINGVKRTLSKLRDDENRREQAVFVAEKKEERERKTAAPLPWGRYAAVGGGALALLLAVWFLPKMFQGDNSDGVTFSHPVTDTTLNEPTVSDNLKRDSSPASQPIQVEKPTEAKTSSSPASNEEKPSTINPPPSAINFSYPMERIAGGTFTMGSHESEVGRNSDECQHEVTVKSFSMGKFEVTQAQWKAIMGNNPSRFKGCDNCPVETVSWDDVQEFIKKLNAVTGDNYRLPTEAEWEYAARGGNKTQYYKYAGRDSPDNVAWHSANSGQKTHPVGSKAPNELRLYDMSGNVSEWCQDKYGPYLGCSKPKEMTSSRVLRGGSWGDNPDYCRAGYRFSWYPYNHDIALGFRLAR